jgi:hypothetical protein
LNVAVVSAKFAGDEDCRRRVAKLRALDAEG